MFGVRTMGDSKEQESTKPSSQASTSRRQSFRESLKIDIGAVWSSSASDFRKSSSLTKILKYHKSNLRQLAAILFDELSKNDNYQSYKDNEELKGYLSKLKNTELPLSELVKDETISKLIEALILMEKKLAPTLPLFRGTTKTHVKLVIALMGYIAFGQEQISPRQLITESRMRFWSSDNDWQLSTTQSSKLMPIILGSQRSTIKFIFNDFLNKSKVKNKLLMSANDTIRFIAFFVIGYWFYPQDRNYPSELISNGQKQKLLRDEFVTDPSLLIYLLKEIDEFHNIQEKAKVERTDTTTLTDITSKYNSVNAVISDCREFHVFKVKSRELGQYDCINLCQLQLLEYLGKIKFKDIFDRSSKSPRINITYLTRMLKSLPNESKEFLANLHDAFSNMASSSASTGRQLAAKQTLDIFLFYIFTPCLLAFGDSEMSAKPENYKKYYLALESFINTNPIPKVQPSHATSVKLPHHGEMSTTELASITRSMSGDIAGLAAVFSDVIKPITTTQTTLGR